MKIEANQHQKVGTFVLSAGVLLIVLSQPLFVLAADRVVGNMMLINDNGGWCWYQDDKIIYDPVGGNVLTSTAANGTGFGGVSGARTNDMDSTTFNIDTGKRTRFNAHEGFGGDDHNMGAFWIRDRKSTRLNSSHGYIS